MKISEILKYQGLFSKEIRQRFKNGQIKLNGNITNDIELDVKFDDDDELIIFDAGDIIFKLILKDKKVYHQLLVFDYETISLSNLNCELKKFFDKYHIIRFSKKDIILIEKS